MNRRELEHAVAVATEEVMESMFYLSSDESPVADEADIADGIQREVEFAQPVPGTFGIGAALIDARTYAANFLGEDPEDVEEESVGEIFGEMANILCGSVLARLHPSRAVELSSPMPASLDRAMLEAARVFRCFSFEGRSLTVWIR